jgi:diguanylate cyclase (GGDEF)-like protein
MIGNFEAQRLRALSRYDILDTPREDAFERITRLVSALFDVPIAAVTLVDEDRQWFKSMRGLGISQTPRSDSFCAHTMLDNAPLVVNDAATDPRFANNRLVTGEPHIRFYAGVALCSADGSPLGALCAIDTRPREIDPTKLGALRDLAHLTMEQLELRLMAMVDGLTGAVRRTPFLAAAERELALAIRQGSPISCLMIDADNFKTINDKWGHSIGDAVLVEVARAIRKKLRRSDSLGRVGGEEFCALLPGTELDGALLVAERMRSCVAGLALEEMPGRTSVTVSIGAAQLSASDISFKDLLARADAALYEAKHNGRNRVAA